MGPPSASTTARSLGFHWSILYLLVPSDTSSQAAMIAAFSSSVLANFWLPVHRLGQSVPNMIIQGIEIRGIRWPLVFRDEPTMPGQALLAHKTDRHCKITDARAVGHGLVFLGLFTGVTEPNISAKTGKKKHNTSYFTQVSSDTISTKIELYIVLQIDVPLLK